MQIITAGRFRFMEIKRFKTLLKQNGHFVTKPRLRLFAILQKRPALTLQQLIKLSPQHDQVTVYRNIDLFEKLGIINRLRLGWHTKIELSDVFIHHHHHFSCLKCGRVITLPEDPVIEQRITRLGVNKHFKSMDHQLEIRGYCQICSNRQ